MGLLDILNGMQHGPHGQPQPGSSGSSSGMSPITMALLGVLKSSGGLGNIAREPRGLPEGGDRNPTLRMKSRSDFVRGMEKTAKKAEQSPALPNAW